MSKPQESSVMRFGGPELLSSSVVTPSSSAEIEPFIGILGGLLPNEHPVERLFVPRFDTEKSVIERVFWLGAPIRGEMGIVPSGKARAEDATNTFYIFQRGDVSVSTVVRRFPKLPFGKPISGGLYREDLPNIDGNVTTFLSQRTLVAHALFAVLYPSQKKVRSWSEVQAHARLRRS